MARKTTKGLTYFNIDCVFEDNLELVIAKHGAVGFGIVVLLWRKIYQVNGYYCDWDDKNIYLFAKDANLDKSAIDTIVQTCFEEGIFNKGLYEKYKILTSTGVQKRWLKIVIDAKRKDTEIEAKYKIPDNTPDDSVNTPELITNTPEEIPQIRVKESKEEEMKEEDGLAPIINHLPANRSDSFLELETLKNDSLRDEPFVRMYFGWGLTPEILSKWLDAFHRHLAYEGTSIKQQRDYRRHFGNWLKFQPYRTGNPDDYQPVTPGNNSGKGTPSPGSFMKKI